VAEAWRHRPKGERHDHGRTDDGRRLRPGGDAAGGVLVRGAVPVLGGRGPRRGCLRRVQRLPLRPRHDPRGRRERAVVHQRVPHPRQRADAGQLAGGELRRRPGQRRAVPGDPGRLPRAAGRAPGRPGRAGGRGRRRRAGADPARDPRRDRHPAHRRGRVRGDGAVPQPRRGHPAGLGVLDRPRLARLCVPGPAPHREPARAWDGLVLRGRNAIQSDSRIAYTATS
jgi:hypothetical protein